MVLLAGLLLGMSGRPGTATPLVILAVVYVVTFLAIEPWTTRRAFPPGQHGPPGPSPPGAGPGE
jgi:hypothetical protein